MKPPEALIPLKMTQVTPHRAPHFALGNRYCAFYIYVLEKPGGMSRQCGRSDGPAGTSLSVDDKHRDQGEEGGEREKKEPDPGPDKGDGEGDSEERGSEGGVVTRAKRIKVA